MRYETINKIYKILAKEIEPERIITDDKFYYELFDDSIRYVVVLQSGLFLIRFTNGFGVIFDSLIKDKWAIGQYLFQFDNKTVASVEVD